MEDRIKDCEIKPLQPGDLCQRAPVCQLHYMQKYQRKHGQRLSRLCAYVLVFTSANSSMLCVYLQFVCIPESVSAYSSLFSFTHAASSLPPASVSERDLRISPGPQGSCLD